jgi:WD40 repeat protein
MRRIALVLLGVLAGDFQAQPARPRLAATSSSDSKSIQAPGGVGTNQEPLPPRALARIGSLRLHQGEWTYAIAYSPDGARLVSAGSTEARLWDAATGKEALRLKALEVDPPAAGPLPDGNRPCAAAVSPDGRRVAWGYRDQRVRIMDLTTGKEVRAFSGHTSPQFHPPAMAFTQDGQFFAVEVAEPGQNTIRLWDLNTGERAQTLVQSFAHRSEALAFSPDGTILASAVFEETIRLWDVASGKLMRDLNGRYRTRVVAFAPNGKMLVSAGDTRARLWDVASGKQLHVLSGHEPTVQAAAFSPDGETLAVSSDDNTIRLWNTASGKQLLRLEGYRFECNALSFSPDGRVLAAASWDGLIRCWDVATGTRLQPVYGHEAGVTAVAVAPDEKRVASASHDHTVRVWDAASGKPLLKLAGHTSAVSAVAFAPNGKLLASAGQDQTIRIWDAATGKELRHMKKWREPVHALAFSPDGKLLASGSGWKGLGTVPSGRVRLWDSATGEQRACFHASEFQVTSVSFLAGGTQLMASGGNGTQFSWEVATGKEVMRRQSWSAVVAPSPDGRTLAGASWYLALHPGMPFGFVAPQETQKLRCWDLATGKETLAVNARDDAVVVAFSPCDRHLAYGSRYGTIRLLDPDTGKETLELSGHYGAVTCLAFMPDGRRLVSGAEDGTMLVWDVSQP